MLPACLRRLVVAYLLPYSFAVNSLWSTDRTCLAFGRILRLETFCIQARCFAKKRVRLFTWRVTGSTEVIPGDHRAITSGLPTRTKPLARRTMPRGEPRDFRNS